MSIAVDDLLKTAERHGVDPRPWGDFLDLPVLSTAGSVTPGVVGECIRILADRAEAAQPPAPSNKFNAWIAAFGDPGSLRHLVDDSTHSKVDLPYAAARVLGLPIWPAISGKPTATGPPSCRLCGAANRDLGRRIGCSEVDPTIAEPLEEARLEPPRAGLDNHGEHPSVCSHLPLSASLTRRHDNFVRFNVRVARECGIDAALHDLPIGAQGDPALRPADWMESRVDPACPDGLAVDLTIVCGGSERLKHAEQEKVHKYSDLLRSNPQLGFQVAGISTSGDITNGTAAMLARWSTRRAGKLLLSKQRPRNVLAEVQATFARKFVSLMTYQCRAYWHASSTTDRHRFRPRRQAYTRVQNPNLTLSSVEKVLRDLARECLDPAATLGAFQLANPVAHPHSSTSTLQSRVTHAQRSPS